MDGHLDRAPHTAERSQVRFEARGVLFSGRTVENTEGLVFLHHVLEHLAIARLEDMQRGDRSRKLHHRQWEDWDDSACDVRITHSLSIPQEKPPAGFRLCRRASSASFLPSAFRAVC